MLSPIGVQQLRKDRMAYAIELSAFKSGPGAPSIANQLPIKEKAREYLKAMQRRYIEDMVLKSGFNWVRDGEHSNKLFFRAARQRVAQSHIPEIKVGNLVSTDHEQKKKIIQASFSKTFSKRLPNTRALDEVLDAIKSTQSPGHGFQTCFEMFLHATAACGLRDGHH